MLVTKQPVLRRFWYAVMPLDRLDAGPQPFTLLGEDIVLWRQADGTPAAVRDRCCHRTAKLSKGFVDGDHIVCGYHGWTYDCSGACVRIPQQPELAIPAGARVPAYRCQAKFGYAWVCLGEPLAPLPEAEEEARGDRRIHQFDETWSTGALRLMENSFDAAHFAFVHKGTFGQGDQHKPENFSITETGYGFEASMVIPINNPPESHRITGSTEPTTRRQFSNQWHLPFLRKLGLVYPSGIRHTIFTCATPIDDHRIRLIQWLYRNDTEADCPAALLNEWDTRVVLEDRAILESVEADAPVDVARRDEQAMLSDRPGMIMRRRLLELLRAHGETEVHGWPAASPQPKEQAPC
ncbi:MAG TPA: aromatic ring-hydroxylating dioxygenase subunit alpha [Ramlibacter sp.]|jgi:phenylpropionate dioxygenase-like ring-hydroxylating dioxygenase large terminal subunit|uniref:aromatic ring-hydroxylating dioxygenase subunit alpha n=1 Tax=Ramlibacter sp. TaxID=1917967 RepID=UPI002D26B787|nr:aromatic ring-hydroxylating dioxygenase subunit alpha [Ramlibacter sp.]HZY18258.1 aromatic ring-hydroxylating dioxygenase subunit alpha [Ramlibacter sp.]